LRESVYAAKVLSHSAPGITILFITLLIGGGYAFSNVDASLFTHLISCTVGIGVLEESCKCFAALMVFNSFYRKSGRKCSIVPFAIAGLGFGGGEALHYFAAYNAMGSSLFTYFVRAWWCVPLHTAWALILGARVCRTFSEVPEPSETANLQ
jgi:RsiW-degrading membrane proteinase PrsW (M82 family)